MNKKRKLVFATNNDHKLEEARQIMPDGFEIVSLAEIGCHDDIPETADTLEGNALIKARWIHDKYGCDCFADDTGLMVDALGGAPGVYSARYAGEHCSPADNVAKLLGEMNGKENRAAHFATSVALICGGEEHCFEGRVDGQIATEPHGNGGFGYDPIFIAEETGRCFAEMTADEKNAISHRGRAMRKLRDFLGLFVALIVVAVCRFAVPAAEWRLHPSYDGQMERIIDTPDYTYFLGASQDYLLNSKSIGTLYGVVYRYDKEGDELVALNSVNKLTSDMVTAIDYNFTGKYLVIGYIDGNIDLLYDDGKVVNIPGLKLSDSSLDKSINFITVDEASGLIMLATGFGYVSVDGNTAKVKTSRIFNKSMTGAAMFDGKLWLSNADGIFYAEPSAMSWDEFTQVSPYNPVHRMAAIGDEAILVLHGRVGNMASSRIVRKPSGGYMLNELWSNYAISAERYPKGVMLVGRDDLRFYRNDGSERICNLPADYAGSNAGTCDESKIWLSSGRKGISQLRLPAGESSSWTVLKDRFRPNAATAFMSTSMAYHPEYGILVRNHGYETQFNPSAGNYTMTEDLICGYKDMTWKPLSTSYLAPTQALTFQDPVGLAIDPKNSNHVYCGSVDNGMLRLDLANPSNSIHMSHSSDISGGLGQPGFAVIADDTPGSWNRCTFSKPVFDSQDNMWTVYVDNSNPSMSASASAQLWCWTAADRAATTSSSNVRPFTKITLTGVPTAVTPKLAALKYGSNKNLLVFHGQLVATTGSPMVIYDHNGTPGDTSDDKMVQLRSVTDQDGNSYSVLRIYAMCEDPTTGLLWFATATELFTIDPREALNGPSAVARRIKVPRNDGTNLADYLLDNVLIYNIIIDSKGRKWFSTNGAGLVCTSSDGRDILAELTPDNSDIPSDIVYAACENPETNSLMVSTAYGLCEYFMTGTPGAGVESELRVYPNPVKLDYYGYVTIDGLADDAMVKIIDVGANLVKECGMSSAGEMKWDLTDNGNRRVPGGVYFVLATNGPNSDKYSRLGRILVIE